MASTSVKLGPSRATAASARITVGKDRIESKTRSSRLSSQAGPNPATMPRISPIASETETPTAATFSATRPP